jgi:hypothetical protein
MGGADGGRGRAARGAGTKGEKLCLEEHGPGEKPRGLCWNALPGVMQSVGAENQG